MQTNRLQSIDLSVLPKNAQQELYDFFLFLQQRYLLNNHEQSEEKRKNISVEDIFPRMVQPFRPLSREEIYDR